eukprot:TRINITY_DN5887_c0_g1_i5.p1 TRINITY_DN5887_c0_g1~~TRINITY_DN5887_c0_g1_i5.p1  ORF type:complete len:221 (+),score=18.30 TRINITY_DN5887_c0_g1_i5:922-1584(+)
MTMPSSARSPKDVWNSIGVVTRFSALATLFVTATTSIGLVDRRLWQLQPTLIIQGEFWRLATPFLFFGNFQIATSINALVALYHQQSLEQGVFRNRRADYVWMLLFCGFVSLLFGFVLSLRYLSGLFSVCLVWIWARKHEMQRVSFFGLQMQAPWFPWAVVAMRFLSGGSLAPSLAGVFVGNLYIFLADLLPRLHGQHWFRTPAFLYRLFPPTGYAHIIH